MGIVIEIADNLRRFERVRDRAIKMVVWRNMNEKKNAMRWFELRRRGGRVMRSNELAWEKRMLH